MKTRVALMFGGKSVEHEVSVISGIQAYLSMDTEKYDVIPVYLTKKNEMYIGEKIGQIESYKNIDELLKSSQRVIMLNENDKVSLVPHPPKKFGKNTPIDIDIVFPVVHGTNVEDGALQGYFKTLGIPRDGRTNILNVKCDPLMAGSLLAQPCFLPAYHMNKGKWITVLLDGSTDREQVMALVDMSYHLTLGPERRKTNG